MSVMFNRFNKVVNITVLAFLLAGVAVFSACHKKDRLTNSTSSLTVVPAAATVQKNTTKTFSATVVGPQGSASADATWTAALNGGSASSMLSATVGPSVVFTPTTLGDYVITATFGGVVAQSSVAVVTFNTQTATSNSFSVYADALPAGSQFDPGIYISPPGSLTLQEVSNEYAPEGLKFQRATTSTSGSSWGVTLNFHGGSQSKDLSDFKASGNLKFAIRFNRALGSSQFRILVKDSNGNQASRLLTKFTSGVDGTSVDWQEISLPIATFTGINSLDLSHVTVPFGFLWAPLVGGEVIFDIDAVRWEK